jgi:ribosomal protein S18 acetylase RimI-like enzyme
MEHLEVKIHQAGIDELEELQQISRTTFTETFSVHNSEENMRNYLRDNLSLEKLGEELNNPESSFYFAEMKDQVIGYLKLNVGAAQNECKENTGLEIERIYVLKEYHGLTIGQLLFEKAISIAKSTEMQYVWLGVWEKNERAIAFYTKNGFKVVGHHLFKLGDDIQTDYLMKLAL